MALPGNMGVGQPSKLSDSQSKVRGQTTQQSSSCVASGGEGWVCILVRTQLGVSLWCTYDTGECCEHLEEKSDDE